jgi:rubredoxin
MTEQEWFTVQTPTKMLELLPRRGLRYDERKLRLFACACCRHIWDHVHPQARQAVETAERYADWFEAPLSSAELDAAIASVIPSPQADGDTTIARVQRAVCAAVGVALSGNHRDYQPNGVSQAAADAVEQYHGGRTSSTANRHWRAELATQANILRDIFGNPFRSIEFAEQWRTDTAVAVVRQMYDSREFGAMPILADALQDAGCENETILNHCRDSNQVHVRGCWVCDLVLNQDNGQARVDRKFRPL